MQKSKLKVAFLGTPNFIKPVKNLLDSHFTLVEDINQDTDLLVVAAYGEILPEDLINTPKYGAINIHPSLLPKYRGPSPIQSAILNGDEVTGVTLIKMDEKMDHGPIIIAKEIRLSPQDTFDNLSKELFLEGAELLVKIIPDFITGKIAPQPQRHDIATYCSLIKKEDGYFDIDNPPSPEMLDRKIHAYYPWPGVWTKWNGKIVKFLPGGFVQMEGRKAISLKDFLNGYPSFPKIEIKQ